jgi:hypothetical protein
MRSTAQRAGAFCPGELFVRFGLVVLFAFCSREEAVSLVVMQKDGGKIDAEEV